MCSTLNRIALRNRVADREAKLVASFEAKQRAIAKHNGGTFLPLEIQRRKNGTVSDTQLNSVKYLATKVGNAQWQGSYLFRDALSEAPRLIYEVKKWDKEKRKYVLNRGDIAKLSLKQLPFFDNIQSMFNDAKELSREESLVAFNVGGTKVPEDIEEFQYDDGYLVYEPIEYITYKATFGTREIVYTVNDKTNRIFNVMHYSVYEMAYKARNKWLSNMDSLDNINARYESAAISKADRELCIAEGVYGEQSLYMY